MRILGTRSGKIVSKPVSRFTKYDLSGFSGVSAMDRQCQSILYCMVVILSQWSLQGSFAVFMCTRRQCGRQ
ncbi:hypothetical protein T4B_12475 [Trichinella pseudospiralis]|uniref:Uncharacterized protein n=1 Tax=Trichinella pseudospiralis TaxID=6337 RepID=A0A0V1IP35_TRIPS|nr:hypothetical protein T4B_12475 [Trichinella pseudospiralis]